MMFIATRRLWLTSVITVALAAVLFACRNVVSATPLTAIVSSVVISVSISEKLSRRPRAAKVPRLQGSRVPGFWNARARAFERWKP